MLDFWAGGLSKRWTELVEENRELVVLLASATIFFLISFWLHFPELVPKNYSDIVDELWWGREGVRSGKIPYVDYDLEYPALSGIILHLSSLTGSLLSYYASISLSAYLCMLGSLYITHRIGKARGIDNYRLSLFAIFTPSIIYFSVYSFDWLGAFLLMLSIYFLLSKRVEASGLSLGLAGAARIIPLICLPAMVLHEKDWRNRVKIVAFTVVGWLIPNAYFILRDFQGFLSTYTFQAEMMVEDSWLIILSGQRQIISIILLGSLTAFILFKRRDKDLISNCWFLLMAFVLSSYKFPPQYIIMMAPLFALTCQSYLLYISADILNTMIILFWFTPMFNAGNPMAVYSPVQFVAILRQLIIAYIFIDYF